MSDDFIVTVVEDGNITLEVLPNPGPTIAIDQSVPNQIITLNIGPPGPPGGLIYPIREVAGDATLLPGDEYVLAASSTGTQTFSLPDISAEDGKSYKIKKVGAAILSIAPFSPSQTIDGQTGLLINKLYTSFEIISCGGMWWLF